ncbi:MAG: hypothetical protein J5496_04635 [Lachnospiraceae bacterium]|nr:hypothetical protein [Lachnospiraceae bacterium]
MHVKRLIALFFTAILLLSLTACGKKETPEKLLRFPDTKWQTLNPYLANASEDLLNDFSQARLYRRFANEDRETVSIRPELAESEPEQTDAEGKVWRIKIRPNLFFVDSEGKKTDKAINAHTFEASLKAALDPVMAQRAGDNLGQYISILNAREYFHQTPEARVDWASVGIKAVDDLTLELTLSAAATKRNVMQQFIGYGTVPTDPELFASLKSADGKTTAYGTEVEKTLYCGAFYVTKWVKESVITLTKNPYYVFADEIKIDKAELHYVESYQTQAEMYLSGQLDATALTSQTAVRYMEREDYVSYAARYIMQIEINRGNTKQPILDNQNFKDALWYAVDRAGLAKLVAGTPANYIIPDTSLADPEKGIYFKDTETAKSYRETIEESYDAAKAKALFDKALEEEKIAGKLSLHLLIASDDPEMKTSALFLQQHLEEIFGAERFELLIDEVPNKTRLSTMKAFRDDPDSYELGLSKWSREATDESPFNVLDVYSDTYWKQANAPYGNEFINRTITLQDTDPRVKNDRAYNVQLAGEMEKAALEARLTIPLFEVSFQYLISPKLILPLKNPSPSLGFTFKPWLADMKAE